MQPNRLGASVYESAFVGAAGFVLASPHPLRFFRIDSLSKLDAVGLGLASECLNQNPYRVTSPLRLVCSPQCTSPIRPSRSEQGSRIAQPSPRR